MWTWSAHVVVLILPIGWDVVANDETRVTLDVG